MHGPSGFHAVRSSPSRSPSYRFLHAYRRHVGTGSWYRLRPHELTARSAGISARREQVPDTMFMSARFECTGSAHLGGAS